MPRTVQIEGGSAGRTGDPLRGKKDNARRRNDCESHLGLWCVRGGVCPMAKLKLVFMVASWLAEGQARRGKRCRGCSVSLQAFARRIKAQGQTPIPKASVSPIQGIWTRTSSRAKPVLPVCQSCQRASQHDRR